MTAPPSETAPATAFILLLALAVVIVSTAAVDYTRLWLLIVPTSSWLASFTAGRLIERYLGNILPEQPSLLTRLVGYTGIGLATLSFVLVICGLLGVIWVCGLVVLTLVVIGVVQSSRQWQYIFLGKPSVSLLLNGVTLGILITLAWLWATIPPTFYDELAYRLVIPQRAVATGALVSYHWMFFTLMPSATDLLLTWGMATADGIGARAMHWSIWSLSLLALWSLAEAIETPTNSRFLPGLLCLGWSSSTTFWFLGTLSFSEAGLTLAVALALGLILSSNTEKKPWLGLGILLGFCCAIKLTGITWAIALLAAASYAGWGMPDLVRASGLLIIGAVPWWGRAWMLTGNPFYPMAYRWLGGSPWSDASQARAYADISPSVFTLGWADSLRLPLDIAAHPERFGSGGDLGMVFVAAWMVMLLLPVLARILSTDAQLRHTIGVTSVLVHLATAVWLMTSATPRFAAPAILISVTLLCALTARYGRALTWVLGFCLLPCALWGVSQFLTLHETIFASSKVAMGQQPREEYLLRQLGHYETARFVTTSLPVDARVLFIGEARSYYFSRDALAPSAYDRHPLTQWVQESASAQELAKRLVKEGISHVVLNVPEFRRLQQSYGMLAFSGDRAGDQERRLHELPRTLRTMFSAKGVYVFEVPR